MTIAIVHVYVYSTALRALLDAVAPRRKDTGVVVGNPIAHGPVREAVVRLCRGQTGYPIQPGMGTMEAVRRDRVS
jgi:hypothetical protein